MKTEEIEKLLKREFKMLINGELVHSQNREVMDTVNPATAKVIGTFPDAAKEDINHAVEAAKNSQIEWARLSLIERQSVLTKISKVLRDHSEELGALDSMENGNVYSHMRNDATGGAFMLDYFCGISNEMKGESTQLDSNIHYTRREPFGVVAKLLPFNHPIQSLGAGIGPPLLTGNTVILKPSPHTSLSALAFGELIKDIVPPGVVNIISGNNERVAQGLMHHPDIPRLSVTGSTEVGKIAMRAAAEHLKTVTLELGGKTPMIIFDDADIPVCVDTALKGMNLKWQGHSCSSTSRVLIHQSIHDEFVCQLANEFRSIRIGDPFNARTEMGPISHKDQFNRVQGYIESGKSEGATLVCGGAPVDANTQGYFLSPAIFTNVKPDMRIAQEEIYGPVISIMQYETDQQAVEIANSVEYGLAAVVMTRSLDRAHRTAHQLQSGFVEINGPVSFALGSPFGGFKSSGIGREGNMEELLSYTQLKSININIS